MPVGEHSSPVRREVAAPVARNSFFLSRVMPWTASARSASNTGSALEYGTYLGGRAGELSGGIAVDGAGAAYVSGTTRSPDSTSSI